jgi:hypothetical protein
MQFVIPTIFSAVDKVTQVTNTISNSVRSLADKSEAANARSSRLWNGIGKGADGAFNKVVNLKNALIATGVAAAGVKLFNLAADTASFADGLATTAGRLGVTTQAYQELTYAAKLQNVEQETLTGSLEKLNKNLGDLHSGQGTLQTKLAKTNPALLKQLKHVKDSEQAFNLISAAIIKLPNQMDRASLAQAAFGKSGQQMLNLIQEGPARIAAMREEARKLGIVLSDEAVAAAQKFDDANDRMKFTIMGLKNSLGSELMPVIQQYMEKATAWVMNNRELIQQKVEAFVTGISNAVQFLVQHSDQLISGFKLLVETLVVLKAISWATAIIQGGQAVAMGILKTIAFLTNAEYRALTIAQWKLNAAMLANPVTLITLAIIALIAIVVVIANKTTGWAETWASAMEWMKAVWAVFKNTLILSWQILKNEFLLFVEDMVTAWKWSQNKLGLLSDEKFAKDKAKIEAERQARLKSISETTQAMIDAGKRVSQGVDWQVRMKTEEEKKHSGINKMFQSPQMQEPEATEPVKPLNPAAKAAFVQQQFNMQSGGKENSQVELIIKDQTGKAEVAKNKNNIPIKLTSTLGQFG